jgi:hypothetical protein
VNELEFPIAHMIGISTACSSYVKYMESMSRNAGTIQASVTPRKKRTTKILAKFRHGTCNKRMPPLTHRQPFESGLFK